MISDIAIARELERNPGITRLQAYRRIKAREIILPRIRRPLDVTDAEQFPNIAEAVAHAKNLRGV